jgi:hypothetical protein
MNWWCRGKTSAWLSEGQWFEPGCWQFFLLGNYQTSEIILGWEREQSRKTPVWKQEHYTIFKNPGIFRVGVGEFLGKLRSGNRYTIQIYKNPWRTPGYSKKFIQPTEGNCFPGQEKFDH